MSNRLDLERLKRCREKLGITKQEVAKRIGVSQPAYLRYEAGLRNPSAPVIQEIAKAFHTSADYLTGKSSSSLPDVIIVDRNEDPTLFSVVNICTNLDNKQLKRLITYLNKLE